MGQAQSSQTFLYYFYEGVRLFDTEQYDQAMGHMLFAEQLCPEDAAVQHYLGNLFLLYNQQEIALKHYKKAYTAEPTLYWESYASVLYHLKDIDGARAVLEKTCKADPNNENALESLFTVYRNTGQQKKALKVHQRLIQLQGESNSSAITSYRLLVEQGKIGKAIAVLEKFLQTHPDDYYVQGYLGDAYIQTGLEEKGVAFLLAQREQYPDNIYVLLTLSEYYKYKKDYPTSAQYLSEAILSEQFDIDYRERLLRDESNLQLLLQVNGLLESTLLQLVANHPLQETLHGLLADYYLSLRQYSAAHKAINDQLNLNPKSEDAWRVRLQIEQEGVIFSNKDVLMTVREIYTHFPDSTEWNYHMAVIYIQEEHTDSAIACLKHGMQFAQSQESLRYKAASASMLGDLYANQQALDSAYYYYEECLKLAPEHVYTLNNYAYFLAINGGDLKKAERMSQITIQKEPNNATYLDTYAWILHLQGVNSLAKFYIQKALDNAKEIESKEIQEHYDIIFGKHE